jgi:hypothetical protein
VDHDELQQTLSSIQFVSDLLNIDLHLAAISNTVGVNPLTCNDEPQSWAEALQAGDASHWQAGFQEKLDSLKAMGVYQLIPRSEVLQGCKICKGRPVFRIK